ncbi:PASTA domain-containing protein [Paenarthrobacter aurescens]|uniref:PASTA domain-containing protein n=1 Tax=Paenarthrobacter aurescens (strain TC1) TaxID=290340 RepID=A1R9J3_PAEAT|nr:PASTA domain-containing protein [Paenarthrobacter aurescens]ABM07839.1 conserved hypothetical protein [Paenarthrobacter aurescens TC1]
MVALTGCGEGETQSSSAVASAKSSPTATHRAIVPNLVGKTYLEAESELEKLDYRARIVDSEGIPWQRETVPDEGVLTISTSPAAGSFSGNEYVDVRVNTTEKDFLAGAKARTAAAEVADAEAKIATRYTYMCGGVGQSREYKTFKDVWVGINYKDGGTACTIKILGISPSSKTDLLPTELKLVDTVAAKGVTILNPGSTLERIMNLCAKLDSAYTNQATTVESQAEAEVALTICPDAPHAPALRSTVSNPRIVDGTWTVGQTMEPGTWKTNPGVKGCYWSRNSGGGDIIANDFVDFAPDGVTVLVSAGEGFKSSNCGTWSKLG